jgi:hypothetical protein
MSAPTEENARAGEELVYRHPENASGEPMLGLYLDRVSFLDSGKLKCVDRLVVGRPREIQAQVQALDLALGDTVGPDPSTAPGWAGYRSLEYPVASRVLTSLEKAR